MAAPNAARAAPRDADGDPRNAQTFSGVGQFDSASLARDQRLLSLDFIGECGDALILAGSAVCAAASAERLDVLEMALRAARAALLEAISEFRVIAPSSDGGADARDP